MNLIYTVLLKSALIKNIKDFISSLTLIDIVFFFSVLLLMILVVILLYFIKINEDQVEEVNMNTEVDSTDSFITDVNNNYENTTNTLNELNTYVPVNDTYNQNIDTINNNVSANTFNGNLSEYYDDYDDEKAELLDLKAITKALENNEVSEFDLSSFEEEQEREAIISYEELLNKARNNNLGKPSNPNTYTAAVKSTKPSFMDDVNIPYKNELLFDDLTVREVDLDSIISEQENSVVNNQNVKSLSYEEEEKFLESLKSLQKMIN